MTTKGTKEKKGENLCTLRLAGRPPNGPADRMITSSSTVLSAGKISAFTRACATVSGCIIFLRGASGQSVFQIAVSVAPGRSAITRKDDATGNCGAGSGKRADLTCGKYS